MKYAEQGDHYVKIFANCFITRGVVRSLLVDGYRGLFDFIPNDLCDLLEQAETCKLGELYAEYGAENASIIDEYLDFLLAKEYAFFITEAEKDCFPALSTEWRFPGKVANAIIDLSAESHYDVANVLQQLNELQ